MDDYLNIIETINSIIEIGIRDRKSTSNLSPKTMTKNIDAEEIEYEEIQDTI